MEKCPVSGTDEIVLAYGPLVRSVARRYARDRQEIEDFVQEGFCALLRLIPLCPAHFHLPAWLSYRLPPAIRNVAHAARNASFLPIEVEEDDEPAFPDEQATFERERVELELLLERTLEGLDLEIARSLWDGLSVTDVAANLGVSRQYVSKRLGNIRAVLRRAFESEPRSLHPLQ